jgi:hypothetical protein
VDWWPVAGLIVSGYLLRVIQEHVVEAYWARRVRPITDAIDEMLGFRK